MKTIYVLIPYSRTKKESREIYIVRLQNIGSNKHYSSVDNKYSNKGHTLHREREKKKWHPKVIKREIEINFYMVTTRVHTHPKKKLNRIEVNRHSVQNVNLNLLKTGKEGTYW